ncbi:MAG: UDP-N-acetylmuramoyl-tripeptide--D-alanyl-D-alanine ligase [Candidatus Xenobia bacterium]
MLPLTLDEVVVATHGRLEKGGGELRIAGVSTDTRTLRPGELFTPLEGLNFDGHDFIPQALERGAVAVISRRPLELAVPVIRVENTLSSYQQLAAYYRRRLGCKVVGVTGSNGKTSTKDLLAHLASCGHRVAKTAENLNNEIGLPRTILELPPDTQVAVLEMGMRGPGQIRELALIATPDVGIVTNVGEAHQELLGSAEAIAEAKGELVENLAPDGVAVLNRDNRWFARLRQKAAGRVISFGFDPAADVRIVSFVPRGWDGSEVTMEADGERLTFDSPLLGRHLAANLAAAVAACIALEIPLAPLPEQLRSFRSGAKRLEVTPGKDGVRFINDAYNASPTSMRAALELLPTLPCDGRRIAVLGDMLELGSIREAAHREMGEVAASRGVDVLIAVGELGRLIGQGYQKAGGREMHHAADASAAAQTLGALTRPGDLVLVKASRGMALERVVQALS